MGVIGDAAYCPSPISGTGTSVAIVGAYVLVGEISRYGTDYGKALRGVRKPHEAVCRSSAEAAAGGAGDCESGDGVGEGTSVLNEVLWVGNFVGEVGRAAGGWDRVAGV